MVTDRKLKAYQIVGIDTAMHLQRPGARWEYTGGVGFTVWDDPRPCPSVDEVFDVIEKLRAFEDSINTILLPEQEAQMEKRISEIEKAYN